MQDTTLRPLAGIRRASADEARLRAIVDWERGMHDRRRDVRDDVREAAYDKAVDGLLKDNTLGRDSHGDASPAMVRGLAERCLSWTRADDLRTRLTPTGRPQLHPRAAASLDALLDPVEDAGTRGDHVAAGDAAPEDVAHWRGQLREMWRRAEAAGPLTRDVIAAYLLGDDPVNVAARHGVGRNAVHQAKSRFVARNPELGR